MWHMYGVGWGWWLLMSVGMVAFWGLVIWGIVTLARGGVPRSPLQEKEQDRPLEILQRRLARGEISVEEYDKLRDALVASRERTPA